MEVEIELVTGAVGLTVVLGVETNWIGRRSMGLGGTKVEETI